MAESETSVRNIGIADLRSIIVDSDELRKGMELFDRNEIKNLGRYASKLFGESKGSGASPYKITVSFTEASGTVRAKCTCPASWSRPFCKHAAGLLVAWARAPEAFVVADGPPPGVADGKKKAAVKRGKVADSDLRKQGIEQVVTLARELGASGIAATGEERLAQIQKLGEDLREWKLRRLAARTFDLDALLRGAITQRAPVPALAYTDLVADVLLTARKLEKHLTSGEPLDPRHVEELLGKTWQKTDLEAREGLDLIEYAYQTRVTSDQFVIYESRFFDLASGTHYSEKVISPLAFRSGDGPKPSRAGAVLVGLRGGRYPGYPPFRLKISDLGDRQPVDHAALARLVEKALPEVGSALAALSEHRRDVFAPDLLPVALRVDTLFSRGGRMQAVDVEGHALHLPNAPALEDRLGSALGGAKLVALLGDLGIEAALPTIFPLAAVVEGPLGFELRALAGNDAASSAAQPEAGSAAWVRAAREAGASGAAIVLAEVREALADAFVVGLAALTPRTTDPLEGRLRELGLEKQAALLRAITAAPVEARLDDFVKLYQVLGIALVRLAGATEVDRATLVRVPTYESVFVKKPDAWLDPEQITAQRLAGTIGRYEAAVQYAHHYESLPPEALAESIYPTWADGSASPYVVRAFAGRRDAAIAAAKKALSGKGGRVAKITALRVLAAVSGLEAERILHEVMTTERDIGMRALAADARDAIESRTLGPQAVQRRRAPTLEKVAEATNVLVSASRKEERAGAITRLVQLGHLSAIPALRQAFLTDAAQDVREEAALAIALLGDTEMVDTFVSMLRRRGEDDRDAKVAAHALGVLGDVRGLRELLAAFSEGYKPGVIAEALRSMGPVALDPLLVLIESHEKLAERQATKSVLEQLPDRDLTAALVTRVRVRAQMSDFAAVAPTYLKLAQVHPDCRRAVGQAVLDAILDPDAHKALVKAARKALG
ncbi:Hypothetical protein A7982_07744 [Minicystis rosea]|nr:Hypothetical protein A7982_07744 [Minicystis rosea]